eukprot:776243-Pleurochrysis_carterae.AAC.1
MAGCATPPTKRRRRVGFFAWLRRRPTARWQPPKAAPRPGQVRSVLTGIAKATAASVNWLVR